MADNTSKKTIINFCPTGMVPTKKMTPHVPVQPNEVIEQTHEAYELGITIAHLHARDSNEVGTYHKSIYQQIFDGVRKHCPDLVICGSSSGRNFPEFEKRSEVLELKPDMCSLTLSSLNFMKQASINAPDMILKLASKMEKFGVHPELECFDLGMINYGLYMIKKDLVKGPFYWNLLFGNIFGMQPTLSHFSAAINSIPNNHHISLAGLGQNQLAVNSLAISQGYGVRVGIEDNIWWDNEKSVKCTNIGLVKRIHDLIALNQKTFFPPKEFGNLGFYNTKK